MSVRPLTAEERQALERGRKAADAFTVRRSQLLLASAAGLSAAAIGRVVGCTAQSVRNAIRAFAADGLGCLAAKSHARKDPGRLWDRDRDEDLKDLLHRRPREFGKATSLWTLALVAEVCHAKGWTPRILSVEAIRLALQRLGVGGQRAKHGLTSPDPQYTRKKKLRDRLIAQAARDPAWVVGFQDETWWTRLAQPGLFAWAPDDPLRRVGNARDPKGGGPEAVACYGVLRADTGGLRLRFCDGRPVSATTEAFLGWVCERLAAEG